MVGNQALSWIDNKELFVNELTAGYRWQLAIAERLQSHGIEIDVPELKIRDSISEIPQYKDSIDIIANGKILEAKSRRLPFANQKFPYDSMFVDTVDGWNSKQRKPFAYVIISRIDRVITWIYGGSNSNWSITWAYDNVRKINDRFYTANRTLWKGEKSLVEALHT